MYFCEPEDNDRSSREVVRLVGLYLERSSLVREDLPEYLGTRSSLLDDVRPPYLGTSSLLMEDLPPYFAATDKSSRLREERRLNESSLLRDARPVYFGMVGEGSGSLLVDLV
jgi:hypothetical protein